MSPLARVVVVILVLGGIGGVIYWWKTKQVPPPPPPAPIAQPVKPVVPPPPPPDAAPAIAHPIERETQPLPSLGESDEYIRKALIELLGKKGVLAFLNLDGVVRRFVATVDNLANEHAPLAMWPVNPTPGSFTTENRADATVIAARNEARYAAFIRFAEGADTRRLVALYRRLYPLFQQTYEELGYPGKYFNDRVVEVIDHLLDTPQVPQPIKVKLVELPGGKKSTRPLYQYEDPALERRSAGQKIMLRMGPQHAAVLRAKLREIRAQVVRRPPP
jgi:hypothetical protein